MIINKYGTIENAEFIQTNSAESITHCLHFSDDNKYLIQVETGIKYREAIDVYPCKYTYQEGQIIEVEMPPATQHNSDLYAAASRP